MLSILIASSKGGVGKTTVSTNLAGYFALAGKHTALVDADRQGSARLWCEKRAGMDTAVLPSVLDLEATVPFLNSLSTHERVRRGKLPSGLVANRLKPWTNASQQVLEQLGAWPYPVVAQLRDTQAYVLLAGLGKSLFDYQSEQVRNHQDDWTPLLQWLKKVNKSR